MKQLDFDCLDAGFASDSKRLEEAGDRLVELMRDIAEYHKLKTVAKALGRSQASVSQALRPTREGRNGHSMKVAEDLPWFIANAHNSDLVDYLGSLKELPATKDEQLTALSEAALEYLGPQVHKGLIRAARTKLVTNRRKKVG